MLDAYPVVLEMREKYPKEFEILTRVPVSIQRVHYKRLVILLFGTSNDHNWFTYIYYILHSIGKLSLTKWVLSCEKISNKCLHINGCHANIPNRKFYGHLCCERQSFILPTCQISCLRQLHSNHLYTSVHSNFIA